MPNEKLPDWEDVLSSAAHLQQLLPDAVLVGGTASALYAKHRFSRDADHVLTDLGSHFDSVLSDLESVAGWKTARIKRPVMILGSLDGIETGVRQLIRATPLETAQMVVGGKRITVPTLAEIVRIKGILILRRNATRDYLDFAALANSMGKDLFFSAIARFDELYPQPDDESALLQLQIQLAEPLPYDLEETSLDEYRNLTALRKDWNHVRSVCMDLAVSIFDFLSR
jgi:hypothetical protein